MASPKKHYPRHRLVSAKYGNFILKEWASLREKHSPKEARLVEK